MRGESRSRIIHDNLDFSAKTDVGRVRDHNEDSFLVDRNLNLFIVADGMGGHAAGEVASSIAVNYMRDVILGKRPVLDQINTGDVPAGELPATRQEICDAMEEAVRKACRAIWEEAQKDEVKKGMGTTLSALLIAGEYGFVAHVGDSRIYLLRGKEVRQVTEDHNLINLLLKEGRVEPGQADKVKHKNALTRAVGVYETVEVDVMTFDVLPGDQFLLASDGLTGYFRAEDIPPYLEEEELERVPERLIEEANKQGGKDNITSVVVRLVDLEGVARERCEQLDLRLDRLAGIPMFRFLSYNELLKVFARMTHIAMPEDTAVMEEGGAGEEMYVIVSGGVRVHSGETLIAQLGEGDHFGEMSLIDRAPRSASVTTAVPTTLLRMNRKDFFALLKKETEAAKKILWNFLQVLTVRMRRTNVDLRDALDAQKAADLGGLLRGLE